MMPRSTHIAENILQTYRKRRSSPACYPCFKRKVRCRGGQPCEACTERGHPQICHVEESSKGSRRHPKGKVQHLATAHEKTGSVGSETNVGELSAVRFVQNNLDTLDAQKDTFHVLGMRSTGIPISLTISGSFVPNTDEPVPLRAEILKYYSAFRDLVMPLYPIMPDPLSLEISIEGLLHDPSSQVHPGKLAVILSCLALGAQFTEAEIASRWEISQDLIGRASTYLQRANCIFEPSTEIVQSLLMIGIGLQNLGLSHGAWNLLGLTYRCAQSLGLHLCTRNDEHEYRGAMLWLAVTWQDALMSLRYDRTPLTEDREEESVSTHAAYSFPPYYDVMRMICQASRKLLRQPKIERYDHLNIACRVNELEGIVASAREYLSSRYTARTLQQKFQYHALRIHSSLLMAECCRPSFSVPEADDGSEYKAIRKRGLHHLIVVVESFLELCTFSNVPLRLWSLTQAALSCALVLALRNSKYPCVKSRRLLQRMVDVFKSSDVSNPPPEPFSGNTIPDIYGMHGKSATLSESILSRGTIASVPEGHGRVSESHPENNPTRTELDDDTFDFSINEFLNWPAELSLFDNTFSDSLFQANMDDGSHHAQG